MSTDTRALAEAFSTHRFEDVYERLSPDVEWVVVGGFSLRGRAEVMALCSRTLTDLSDTTTTFERLVCTGDDGVAVVDAICRYTGADGEVSLVSACDVYEFTGGLCARITSYAVELHTTDHG